MSEPKRYSFWGVIVHLPSGGVRPEVHFKVDEDGLFVAYPDYEKLKAEVERLRKAGDVMAEALSLNDDVFDNQEKKEAQAAWNAAKVGEPSEQKSPSFIEDLGNGVEKHDLLFRYPSKETPPHA